MQSRELDLILRELGGALGQVPAESVDAAAKAVVAHRRVFVAGAGRSGLMLKAFAMRLMQMGRTVYAAGETVTPAVEKGDLVILASASGTTRSVLCCAETAERVGADLFVITASPDAPLSAIHPADAVLPCGSGDRAAGSGQVLGSLFEQALLLFCDAVVLALPADPDAMRRRHANLE